MSLDKDLDKLAAALLQDALSAVPPEGTDRLAIFKAVSAHRIGVTRANKGRDDDDPGESFAAMRRKGLEALETKGTT